jgi:hypothetical protein
MNDDAIFWEELLEWIYKPVDEHCGLSTKTRRKKMTEKESTTFYVAGVKFHELHSVIKEVKPGEVLTLEQEPDNKYDPNAIKILRDEVMLGYVPKKLCPSILASMEVGPVTCRILDVVPEESPWKQLLVSIEED